MLKRLITIASCLAASSAWAGDAPVPFSAAAYAQAAATKGVVLVSVNWGRKWKCGAFENARLDAIAFDRVGSPKQGADAKPDFMLEDSSLLPATSRFVNLAYIVEPGHYALSGFRIKVAKSVAEVGTLEASRADLIKDGKSTAGDFNVAAGELIYIGHFFVDCVRDPIPWRFYPGSADDFRQYLEGVSKEFEALPTDQVKFRLLNTKTLGEPFSLP